MHRHLSSYTVEERASSGAEDTRSGAGGEGDTGEQAASSRTEVPTG